MPWIESSVMEERLRFVARLLDGEGMSDVCREFGISRKTGYKIWGRYKQEGLEAHCARIYLASGSAAFAPATLVESFAWCFDLVAGAGFEPATFRL